MRITKYPQSCFLLEYNGLTILIDPGKYCYEAGFMARDWPKIDVLLLTHIHSDHTLPEAVQEIDGKSHPVILTNQEVARMLSEYSVHAEVLKAGSQREVKGIEVVGVWQLHGDLPSKMPKPEVIGFLIDHAFYHPGDTVATDNPPHAGVVAVPMCGQVTMDPTQAAEWIRRIEPKVAVPMHYHNPKYITDPQLFVQAMEGSGIAIQVLNGGESIEVEI